MYIYIYIRTISLNFIIDYGIIIDIKIHLDGNNKGKANRRNNQYQSRFYGKMRFRASYKCLVFVSYGSGNHAQHVSFLQYLMAKVDGNLYVAIFSASIIIILSTSHLVNIRILKFLMVRVFPPNSFLFPFIIVFVKNEHPNNTNIP